MRRGSPRSPPGCARWGFRPISIEEAPEGTGLNRELNLSFGSGVKLKDLAIMSRQMATMIGAGLSLLRTLNILAEQTENKKLAKILGAVRDDVETGVSISDAMRKHARCLPTAHDQHGQGGRDRRLPRQRRSIRSPSNFEKEVKLRGTIKSALTYPVIVLIMSLVAVIAMLLFIVPIFENMFEGLGGQLPLPDGDPRRAVARDGVDSTDADRRLHRRSLSGGHGTRTPSAYVERVDPIKLKLPVFGSLMKKIAVARFAATSRT